MSHATAGFLSMKGEFFQFHRDEIMHLLHNHENANGLNIRSNASWQLKKKRMKHW